MLRSKDSMIQIDANGAFSRDYVSISSDLNVSLGRIHMRN